MLLLGIDVGTSSIKVSVVDAESGKLIAAATHPETETAIESPSPGWAEQSPDMWWNHVKQAILKANASKKYDPKNIGAIGISYQMHGLVMVDENMESIHNTIIWCDSRAVETGEKAFEEIGSDYCLNNLLNSPGNFTASKLAWIKKNKPEVYNRINKIMLPGDFIAAKFTGQITTTVSALSEGIFWDFQSNGLSEKVMNYFGFDSSFIPSVQPLFSSHGEVKKEIADELSLITGIPVTYKAGDQPNNALSLNVLQPGAVAATAGTSGVIYGVSDQLSGDPKSRVNSFAHVNHTEENNRIGILLCINGTGIQYGWLKKNTGSSDYQAMNNASAEIKSGSEGLFIFPFGNGAERIFENKIPGAHVHGLNFNLHTQKHLWRAAQEGIAFAFRYGFDILKENKMQPSVIRAGKANMFLSPVFTDILVNTLNVPIEMYETDGSRGAAIGAGIGTGFYKSEQEAFRNFITLEKIEPGKTKNQYDELYQQWKMILQSYL